MRVYQTGNFKNSRVALVVKPFEQKELPMTGRCDKPSSYNLNLPAPWLVSAVKFPLTRSHKYSSLSWWDCVGSTPFAVAVNSLRTSILCNFLLNLSLKYAALRNCPTTPGLIYIIV